ncbi:hypothetical protein TWF106_004868 [Orbilia oligospora]|uniref:C2H2-type domain-containing protein n=1 Tax=Orbilia oligospora TaxID=2813651 RepID=A0A7C8UTP8_ORBOL|nr:hypothetical protein TWF106_004868 [Orbilia oligospora]
MDRQDFYVIQPNGAVQSYIMHVSLFFDSSSFSASDYLIFAESEEGQSPNSFCSSSEDLEHRTQDHSETSESERLVNSSSFNPHQNDIPVINCPEPSLTEIFAQVAATSSAGSSCDQIDSSGLPFYHPELTTPCIGIHDQQVIVETSHPQPIDCSFPLDEFEWFNWTDICVEQIHTTISPPEVSFRSEPHKNETLSSSIFDMPELSPSLSSEMENSPRLSVGTEEMANSSPAASLSPIKDGGQQTPKSFGEDLKRGGIPQGGIRFRKVSAARAPRTKKTPGGASGIRRNHKPKHECSGCLRKFTVKRDLEFHFRRCLGKPYNICLCGAGITTSHNMKAHLSSKEHRERLRVLEEIPSNSNPGQQKTDGGAINTPNAAWNCQGGYQPLKISKEHEVPDAWRAKAAPEGPVACESNDFAANSRYEIDKNTLIPKTPRSRSRSSV